MLNEQIALEMYQDNEHIKRAESFEDYKKRIQHGLDIAAKREMSKKITMISDMDRRDLNLALKYNLQLMTSILK